GNLRPAPGKVRAEKGVCLLHLDDLLTHARDLLLIVIPNDDLDALPKLLPCIERASFAAWLGVTMHRRGDDPRRLIQLKRIAANARMSLIAINDVLYHAPEQRDLQDIMTCIRESVRIEDAGRLLEANAERHLKLPAEMRRLFAMAPEAIEQTQV